MNTKDRHNEIYDAAVQALADIGGIEKVDGLPDPERLPILHKMYKMVINETDCHYDTAKRNVVKAMRRAKGQRIKGKWGGKRPGAGRPKGELTITLKPTPPGLGGEKDLKC